MNAAGNVRLPTRINLALQGGGAHGAFTWGVLDHLLESTQIDFEGISATSSGAMNALALAQGWLEGGRDGARRALEELWTSVANHTSVMRWSFSTPAGATAQSLLGSLAQYFTPSEMNPLGLNPVRDVAVRLFDFERLRRESPFRLYLAATRVRDGQLVLFDNDRLSIDALMASTCLPQIFAPVEIDSELYWDGGYAGNPAIEPLIYHCRSSHVVCVLVQPLRRAGVPRTARQIAERVAELMFSTTFLRELNSLRDAKASIAGTFPLSWLGRRLKSIDVQLLEPGESLDAYSARTRMDTRIGFLHNLRDLGRERARSWIDAKTSSS
ncbi:MAG: patatin-like phospholipase family protein [Rudaea sp.]